MSNSVVTGKMPIKIHLVTLLVILVGSRAQAEESRIINGEDAELGQFPYQAKLIIQTDQGRALCGGSLISEEWVLTAAHCVESARSVEVTLGAVDLNDQGNDGRTVLNSTEYVRHPNYQASSASNDVAVVRLPERVTYSDRIQPVKLPTGHDDYNRRLALVSGWGKTRDMGGVAQKLQYTTLTVIRNNECSLFYGPGTIQPTTLCCRGANRRSTCNGDSGGPLVLEDDKTQIGVVSFGNVIGCEKMFPVGFARLTEFTDFIRETTGVEAMRAPVRNHVSNFLLLNMPNRN
ncbi:collagenase-like [Topomyia yanbarensis]|uniref:collagenase-like n=1 Tax=Topomyia yanbarensis TaxID=2498891 RepID=UPI00273A8919|nr:collagenase-like [Topomyia yanbarensis]